MDKFDEHFKFESEIVSDNPSQIEGIKNGEDLSQHIIGIKMGEILRSEKNWTARIKFFEDFIGVIKWFGIILEKMRIIYTC